MIANVHNDLVDQRAAVRFLVEKARADDHSDRRGTQRFPYFRPVVIRAKDQRPVGLSGFSRDISRSGIGLILFWPLEAGPVELMIHVGESEQVTVSGKVHWCHPCGQGWYTAGIGFTGEEPDGFEVPPAV